MADAPPHGQVTRQISATRPSGREDSICWFLPPHEAQGSISGSSLSLLSGMTPSFTRLAASEERRMPLSCECRRGHPRSSGRVKRSPWRGGSTVGKKCRAGRPASRRQAVKCRGQVREYHILPGYARGREKNAPEPEVVSSPPGPGSTRLRQGRGRWPWPVATRSVLSFYR